MFEKPTMVGVSQRVVATLVACAVVAVSTLYYTTVQAASLTNVSDTLGTSEPSVTSAHTIAFTIPAGSALADGDTVTITFEAGFTGIASVADANTDVTVNGTLDADGSATVAGAGQSITFNTVAASAGQEVVVAIDDGVITNPGTVRSYTIDIDTGTGGDAAQTRVSIVDTVTVSAIVETRFDFFITGTATGTAFHGGAQTTTGSTSATAVNFYTLTADTSEILAQHLNVTTNARNGFIVTVEADGDLRSSTGAVIDSFTDGTYVNTPTAWAAPGGGTPTISDDTTWGHWGITSDDDLNADEFAAGGYIAASTSPRVIFAHASSSDGVADNIGSTTIGYQIEISALQEAGDDYQTVLTYIATPTF